MTTSNQNRIAAMRSRPRLRTASSPWIIGGENIYPQDVEEIVCAHSAIHDGRAVALGIFNPALGTQDLAVVAEVQEQELRENRTQIEHEIRAAILADLGVAARFLFLKPPKWIVKNTAGNPARSTTREKLLQEHPNLQSGTAHSP